MNYHVPEFKMNFRFNTNEIFKNDIFKISNHLLPEDFTGDRTTANHVASQVAEIVDGMGLASAKAQGLHHPITSAEKLKNCDHTLYLMIDPEDNDGKGSVVGLLKMGEKNLFLSDAAGMTHEKKTLCLLDFYIIESRQRTGFGKKLFEHMLKDKDTVPSKLAIDKPTQNLLSFLYKHYGLSKMYQQNNNFVVFEGFFDETKKSDESFSVESQDNLSDSPKQSHETQMENDYHRGGLHSSSDKREREDYLPHLYGRHMAYKLPDTMGSIIGDSSTDRSNEAPMNGQ